MWLELAAAGFLVGDALYHKLYPNKVEAKTPDLTISRPRIDPGTPVPLIYGRCRIDNPVLAYLRLVNAVGDDNSVLVDALFLVGIGMDDGNGTTRILDMWSGGKRATSSGASVGGDGKWIQTGDGGFEEPVVVSIVDAGEGRVETLNGNPSQSLVAADGTWLTYAGQRMRTDMLTPGLPIDEIPGYRRYASAFLFQIGDGSGWHIGNGEAQSVPTYSFEASSYQDTNGYPAVGVMARIGPDCNPANVIWDLCKAHFGKLGIDVSYLDSDSFSAAATKLYQESHGYSRAIENVQELGKHLYEILYQIGAVMFVEPRTDKIHLKLIRNDYDYASLPQLSRGNCEKIENLAAGGWDRVPNAIRLVYRNRAKDYKEDSVTAMNQANAVGQDGEVRWQVVQMPGVTHEALAKELAARCLAEYSRPLMKFRIHGTRELLRMRPGDPFRLSWAKPDISGLVFRVLEAHHGKLSDGAVALDVVQDVSYQWRALPPKAPHFGVPGIKDLGLR